MPTEAELAGRIGLVVLLAGLVGLEREITDQTAGLRTHISVALGAALFAIVSAYGFDGFDQPREGTTYQIDVTRVASNIVTGVGFLGGGAILKHGATVRGLTTAASMWVTAAIGLAVGLGLYFMATVTTAALLISLVGLRAPRRWVKRHATVRKQAVMIRLRSSGDVSDVIAGLHGLDGIEVRSLSVRAGDEETVIEADLRATSDEQLQNKLGDVAEMPGVADVDASE